MKRALLAVVGLGLLLGCAVTAQAQPQPAADVLRGKVVSVDAEKGTVVVKPRQGDNVTVTTDKDTKVTVDGKEAKLADVKADMGVEVSPKDGVAKTVNARTPGLRGKVVSVDAEKGTLVVKPRQGDDVTVTTDKDTKITVDGKEAKLADVKADMRVEVSPVTGVAKMITARTPRANPNP
jgi:biopolymer transport protein ExbD